MSLYIFSMPKEEAARCKDLLWTFLLVLRSELEDLLDKRPPDLVDLCPLQCADEDLLNWLTWVRNIFYNYLLSHLIISLLIDQVNCFKLIPLKALRTEIRISVIYLIVYYISIKQLIWNLSSLKSFFYLKSSLVILCKQDNCMLEWHLNKAKK
jgi:hypothetical protein